MSAPFDDGGPIASSLHNGEASVTPTGGLSLRDWFAGQALIAIPHVGCGSDLNSEEMAEAAYFVADAMLKARKPKEAP